MIWWRDSINDGIVDYADLSWALPGWRWTKRSLGEAGEGRRIKPLIARSHKMDEWLKLTSDRKGCRREAYRGIWVVVRSNWSVEDLRRRSVRRGWFLGKFKSLIVWIGFQDDDRWILDSPVGMLVVALVLWTEFGECVKKKMQSREAESWLEWLLRPWHFYASTFNITFTQLHIL